MSGYRFLHDRVQQAAYELIDAGERGKVHAQLGRHLLAQGRRRAGRRQAVRGGAAIEPRAWRRSPTAASGWTLARLNLRAGLKVAGSGAHGSALDLLRRCLELLGAGAWTDDHDMTHRAHLTLAECEFMSGNLQGALQLLDAVEANARTALERVAGREVRIVIADQRQPPARGRRLRRRDGAHAGRGVSPRRRAAGPRDRRRAGRAARPARRTAAWSRCSSCPRWPIRRSARWSTCLFKTNASAFMSKPQASVLIGLKAARLAIEHGNAPMSPYFYGNYGIINGAVGGDMDVSYRFSRLGIDLVDKAGYTEIEGSTHFLFGAFNCHWRRPLSQSLEHLRHAVKACLETGAYLHAAWAALIGMYYRFYRGENLEEVLADIPQVMELLRRSENTVAQTLAAGARAEHAGAERADGEPDQPGRRRLRRGRVPGRRPRGSASITSTITCSSSRWCSTPASSSARSSWRRRRCR